MDMAEEMDISETIVKTELDVDDPRDCLEVDIKDELIDESGNVDKVEEYDWTWIAAVDQPPDPLEENIIDGRTYDSSETESENECLFAWNSEPATDVCRCVMLIGEERWAHTGYCRCNKCASLLLRPSDTEIVSVLYDHDYNTNSRLICKTCQPTDTYEPHLQMIYCNICKQLVNKETMAHACKPHSGVNNSPIYESIKIDHNEGITEKVWQAELRLEKLNLQHLKCTFCDKHFTDKSLKVLHSYVHLGAMCFGCNFCNKSFGHVKVKGLDEQGTELIEMKQFLPNKATKLQKASPKDKIVKEFEKGQCSCHRKLQTFEQMEKNLMKTKKKNKLLKRLFAMSETVWNEEREAIQYGGVDVYRRVLEMTLLEKELKTKQRAWEKDRRVMLQTINNLSKRIDFLEKTAKTNRNNDKTSIVVKKWVKIETADPKEVQKNIEALFKNTVNLNLDPECVTFLPNDNKGSRLVCVKLK